MGDKRQIPHGLVIDMGADVEVAGFRYMPRQDKSNGHVRAWRFNVEPAEGE